MRTIKSFLISAFLGYASLGYSQYEMLDSTFNDDGMVTTVIDVNADYIFSIAIQADDKTVAAGMAMISGANQVALARYKLDGSLDSTFGTNGIVLVSVGGLSDAASSVAIQTDGKIVIGGSTYNTTLDFLAIRFLTDGTLDTTFSGDGIAIIPIGSTNDVCRDILIQSDGKIILSGKSQVSSGSNAFGLARLNTDGSLDTNFGTGGVLTTIFGTNSGDFSDCLGIGLQSNGKIVATGEFGQFSGPGAMPFARYNTDGSLDNTFGSGGQMLIFQDTTFSDGLGITIQSDDKIIIISDDSQMSQDNDLVIARLDQDGNPDNTFGSNGVVISDLFGADDYGSSVIMQPDGKILVSGYAFNGTSLMDPFVARFNTNGTSDLTFGTSGAVFSDFGTGGNTSSSLALQSDGKIVIGGCENAGATADFALARYIPQSNTTQITESINSLASVSIYPNPASSYLTLSFTLTKTEIVSVELYGNDGRLIKTYMQSQPISNGTQHLSINLPGELSTGIYHLVVSTSSEKISIRILKN